MQLQKTSRRKNIISLTPLIDIVFILLVFFMLTSSFDRQTGLDLQPATASTTENSVTNFQLLTVTQDGLLLEDQAIIPLDNLLAWADTINDDVTLILTADENAVVQQLLTVLEILQPVLGERLSLASLDEDQMDD